MLQVTRIYKLNRKVTKLTINCQTITNSTRDDEYNKGILILVLFYVLNIKRVFISAGREGHMNPKIIYEEIVVFCSFVLANFACTSLSSMGGSNGIGSRHRSAVATITCAQRI